MMRAKRPLGSPTWASVLLCLAVALAGPAVRAAGDEPAAESDAPKAKAVRVKPDYVDAMLKKAWEEVSIKPSRTAPDPEFLRRAYLDVLGRIPTIQEATSFLENKDSGKRTKLIEYLLANPDYAKNFATVWTVLLLGRKQQDRQVDRTALTSWLRRQFTDNRPWNEMAYDLITARGSNKENGAVNYSLAHLDFGAVPLTSITTRVFLGQQVQCTQCHDHPSNDWKQADFWGINAFFKGVRSQDVEKADATGAEVYDHTEMSDEPTDAFATFDRRSGLVGIAFPTFLDGRKISQGTDVNRREALAKFITAPDNDQFARAFVNRMWGHFMGRGFVHPVDDFGAHNAASHPELLDKLAADFKASGYDIKSLIRWIMASQAYNVTSAMTSANDKDETLFSHMALKPMNPEQLFESLLVATAAQKAGGGDTDRRRDEWMRQFIFAFATDEQDESSSFQGTIPQALMMMNGELIAKAVSGQPGSFLANLFERAGLQRRLPIGRYIVNNLYLAALSRYPSSRELTMAERFLSMAPEEPIPVMQDIFWALLNSNEFILNR